MSSPHNLPSADEEKVLSEREVRIKKEAHQFVQQLPEPVQARVEKLYTLEDEHYALVKEYEREMRELRAKYDALYAPLYEKRAAIVSGEADSDLPKGVPNFWLTALKRNDIVKEFITERDEAALCFLTDIRCETYDEGVSFRIEFEFAENPFFTNKVLTKSYNMEDDQHIREVILRNTEGCEIEWKQGKDLTCKIIRKKQRHKGRGEVRTITKKEPVESFFNYFAAIEINEDTLADGGMQLEQQMESDYELGVIFRENIIPNAAYWFTGIANLFEDMDDYDYDMDGEGEFEEGEDDYPDAAPAQAWAAPTAGGESAGGAGAPGAPGAEKPAECKQQ